MAKVDILLPYWGDVTLFKKTVRSILKQTEQDWKLLIFDDCYSSQVPARFITKLQDKRIQYFRHKKNIGITNNFNFALKSAQSKYCVMMGCDDIMLPNYLVNALNLIGSADFYQPGVSVIDENGRIYLPLGDKVKRMLQPRKSGIYQGEKLAASICRGNWLYFPSILWKTKTINQYGFDAKYKTVEDLVLELNVIKDGGRLFFDKEIAFQYRRHEKSVSSLEKYNEGSRFEEEQYAYNYFAKIFKEMGWKTAARNANLHITSRLHRLIS